METLPQLPQDIIVNILLRLPVKSLLQLKCVSKPWRSLISDPHFAKLQLNQLQRNSKFSSHRVLLVTEPLESAACEASADQDGDSKLVLKLEYPKEMKKTPDSDELMDGSIDLGGSCNGLVCLVFENERVFLWNPTIRETKELPKLSAFDAKGTFSYGFGYDLSTDDCKVVRADRPSSTADTSNETEVEILTLKNNIWRRIEGLESGIEIEGPGIFLHGALHWLGVEEGNGLEVIDVIVSFYLADEKFQLAPLPDQIKESDDSNVLGISGDCLCLFHGCGEAFFEAWLLKDSSKSSWTRLFNVQRNLVPTHKYWEKPLCYTKTGKVVIDYDGQFLVWDPKRNGINEGEAMKTAPQLPQDIIVNIPSRLPVKYPIQLKCVCKPLWSLISDPQFAKLHLAQSKKNNNFSSQRILLVTVPLESAACEASGDGLDVVHLDYPAVMKKSPDSDELVDDLEMEGSCDGLICVIFENGRIFLWNPTIREALELAIDSAFDPKANGSDKTEVQILTLKSNIWRRIEGTQSGTEIEEAGFLLSGGAGIFLNGALYWLAIRANDPKKIFAIVAFHMGIAFLFCGGGYYISDLEAWLLKEYGVKSSWTRLFSVQRDIIPGHKYWENALYHTKTGEVVLDYDGRDLVWYDPKENTSKTFTPQNDWDWFQPDIYIESLVSPNVYCLTNA
ncbi:hypothetical protein CRYUN_Cryun21dG0102700 [Craigia yunnanensis]